MWLGILLAPAGVCAQSVGVVLSGGGAAGLSHIGVLKALEEKKIPIDFICGTSVGAVISGLYASGYSPAQMETLVLSDQFKTWAKGEIEDDCVYFFKQKEADASLISIKFNLDSFMHTSIPTNVISPTGLDFQLMELFSGAAAAAGYDFDSLFVPYRCVASDIAEKKEVVFRKGSLSEAIRASMSYPFYLRPIEVDGKLLFDGGLYNNFPTDVMYRDFLPDIIIGSNVSNELEKPTADNLISQIMNMLLLKREFSMMCDNGILIEPKPDVATFDFSHIPKTIRSGYDAAMAMMDTLKTHIVRRENPVLLHRKRLAFLKQIPPFLIDEVKMSGLSKAQQSYIRQVLNKRKGQSTLEELRPKYFRVLADDKIRFIYPRAFYNDSSGYYDLDLKIKQSRDLETGFGGNFSSRPINTGFVSLRYRFLSRIALSVEANSYFGRFYGSTQMKVRLDFPTRLPFFIEPVFALNRWDYFRSLATFFEDVKPSFLIKHDRYAGLRLGTPVFNHGRIKVEHKFINLKNEYYQTDQFLSSDTADLTDFDGQTAGIIYERSTLNRKQYASKGTHLTFSWRYVFGAERTVFGSTKPETQPLQEIMIRHNWVRARLHYENYFMKRGRFGFGLATEGVYTNIPFFSNYTATILSAPAYQPVPQMKTLFQESFRAHIYAAFGLKTIFELHKNADIRLEGYAFQPYHTLLADHNNEAYYSARFDGRFYVASGALVFHSPLGPVSLTANVYDFKAEHPLSLLFNFGYILHNRAALE